VGDGHYAPEVVVIFEHHSGAQLGRLNQHTALEYSH
jgi:hypothetical protein